MDTEKVEGYNEKKKVDITARDEIEELRNLEDPTVEESKGNTESVSKAKKRTGNN